MSAEPVPSRCPQGCGAEPAGSSGRRTGTALTFQLGPVSPDSNKLKGSDWTVSWSDWACASEGGGGSHV